ncbi:GAD-like domain-containing protein [Plantibacter sp. ME-Dv--P-095]|uniref:GAD-like domain-containing protein n=1 Tax=Plantibacter sp. ME-Dv--P-095 TaxID=3040299 RepID=UPI002551BF67|nr:GAD-like domain-containing protein [Plantibacter sp. ME-Dv--P-095]
MVEISDFITHGPVPEELIEEYRGRVPDELVEVWERYGYGTFGHGFLRVIDPKRYEDQVGDCIGKTQGDGIAIPIMVTGLGDLITWEPSIGVVGILFREGRAVGLNSSVDNFLFMVDLDGPDELSDTLHWDIFPEAVAAHGDLPYEESFVFEPLLSLGGTATVENLHKREIIAAIQVAVDLQGVIGH